MHYTSGDIKLPHQTNINNIILIKTSWKPMQGGISTWQTLTRCSLIRCPVCGKRGREFDVSPNLGLQLSLHDFEFSCTHRDKGCKWIGELRALENHINSDPPASKSHEGCPSTVMYDKKYSFY